VIRFTQSEKGGLIMMTPSEIDRASRLLTRLSEWKERDVLYRKLGGGTYKSEAGYEHHNFTRLASFIRDDLVPNQVAEVLVPIVRGALIDHAANEIRSVTKELQALGVEVPDA
jgi:hypothetical protein